MVLSSKKSSPSPKKFELEYLNLILKLNDVLDSSSDASKFETLFQVTRFVLAKTSATRMVILESKNGQSDIPLNYETVVDTKFPKNKSLGDHKLHLKKSSKRLKESFSDNVISSLSLTSELKLKTCHPDWLSSFKEANAFIFPVRGSDDISGLIYLNFENSKSLTEELKSFFMVMAKTIHFSLRKGAFVKKPDIHNWLFNNFEYPVFILDKNSKRIKKANKKFDLSANDSPVDFLTIIESTANKVSDKNPLVWNRGYLPNVSGDFFIVATKFGVTDQDDIYVLIIPANEKKWDLGILLKKLTSENVALEAATKQLYWDRLIQQVVTRLHSTLDQNMILQLLVDNIGQCLNSSSCLFVKKEPTSLSVSHEYTNPSISPLGFGRTTKFPTSVVELITNGPFALSDVTSLRQGSSISSTDISSLLNSEINSFAGAPIYCNGILYGALIVVQIGENRDWTSNEMEMIRIASRHSAISLELAIEHQKLKDQLYLANTTPPTQQENISKVQTRAENDAIKALSERELEVLRLIASGLSNKEIAGRLFLTASTVELHASRMRKKLKMKSRTQLVKFACDYGLV